MKISLTIIASFFAILSFFNCQDKENEVTNRSEINKSEMNYVPAKTYPEYLEIIKDRNNNMIRTSQELNKCLSENRTFITKLNEGDLKIFLSTIRFSTYGVSTLNYKIIKDKLLQSEYAHVMASFGLDVISGYWDGASILKNARTTEDEPMKGYRCEQFVCVRDPDMLCICN